MKRGMRRAWRKDHKRRKRRMTIMAQTPTDPVTAGDNDMVWEQVTEDKNLQSLLFAFMTAQNEVEDVYTSTRLQEWLENNIQPCAAVVVTGQMYLSNGDPGYPDEYCDNMVSPGCGEYCADHAGYEGV